MKKVVNFRPILFLAISIIMGILSAYFFIKENFVLAIIFMVLPLLILPFPIIFCSKENRKTYIIFSIIFTLVLIFGGVNFYLRVNQYKKSVISEMEYTFIGKVIEVKEFDSSERLILDKVTFSGEESGKLDGKIALYVYDLTNFDIGDKIQFKTSLEKYTIYFENSFNSSNVAENVKYKASVYLDNVVKVGNNQTIFESVHKFLRDSMKNGLSEQSFSIAYAMTLGNTDYMQEDLLSNFRALGVAHIFAVSGLHIGFFATFLALIFSKIKINRYVKLIITVLVLFFYAGVCGFSASSVRAAIMTALLLSSESLGKKYDRLSSLAFACLVILLYSPAELFRVGFQLSFIVVFGLITSTRIFKKPFKFLGEKGSNFVAGVLVAQVFSIPICLLTFGQVSLISVLANVIILPIIGGFYIINFLLTIIGGIFSISNITLFLPNLVFEGVAYLVKIFDYTVFMAYGVVVGVFAISYYASFVFASGYFNFKRVTNITLAIILIVMSIFGSIVLTAIDNNAVKSFVIGDSSYMVYVMKVEKQGVLVVGKASSSFGNNRVNRAVSKLNLENIDHVIFLENENKTDIVETVSKLSIDYSLKTVYCFNTTENEEMEKYFERFFVNIDYVCVSGEERVIEERYAFNYLQRGHGVSIDYKNIKTNVFTTLPSDFDFVKKFGDKCNLLIVSNYHEILSTLYKTDRIVTFYPTLSFENGYTNGNLEICYR